MEPSDEKGKIKLTFKCPSCGHTHLFTREMVPVYQKVLEIEASKADRSRPLTTRDWDLEETELGDSEAMYESADPDTFEYRCGYCYRSWKTLQDVAKDGGLVDESGKTLVSQNGNK